MSIEYLVICDECARVLTGSQKNAATAREDAKQAGARVALPGGRDLCAVCASPEART